MKKIDAYQRAAEVLTPGVSVAVLGSMSRTWYQDVPVVNEITWWLLEAGATLRIGGTLPFDPLVESAALEQGYDVVCCGPRDYKARLGRKSDDDVMVGVSLVVAFPMQGKDVMTADPLIEAALLENIPILAVYRDSVKFYTAENYVF